MRKLFLAMLAMIVMAGVVFTSSTAWSETGGGLVLDKAYYLSECLTNGDVISNLPFIQTENVYLSALESHKLPNYNKSNFSPPGTIEKPGVFSSPSTSWPNCNIVNSEYATTDTAPGRERVTIYLC
jgi:hypothetical protein